MATVDNGPATELVAGGGLQWDYVIYKSNLAGTPANRYIIQANGYYGYTTTSQAFTNSRIEVEIDLGSNTGPGNNPRESGGFP